MFKLLTNSCLLTIVLDKTPPPTIDCDGICH